MTPARLVALLALAVALAATAVPPQRELRPFTVQSPAAIRAARAGTPFVLALWSIHCEPCRDEMAEWRALGRRHPDLPVVLVSTDAPADRARVLEFLARYDPGKAETWVFADEFAERVRYAVDRNWRGELPRTYLYDAAHRAEARSGRLDRRWIEDWLARQVRPGPALQPPDR